MKRILILCLNCLLFIPAASQAFFWGGSTPPVNKNNQPKTTLWDKIAANIKSEQEDLEKTESYSNLMQELASKRRVLDSQQQAIKNKALADVLLRTSNTIEQSLNTLDEIKTIKEQIAQTFQAHTQKVNEIIANPSFDQFQVAPKTAPTYKDIEDATQNNTRIENLIVEKERLKSSLTSDIYKKKTAINAINDDIKAKKNERESIASLPSNQRILQGELIDQELQLLTLKKIKEEFLIRELTARQRFFETEIAVLRKQLEFAREHYDTIKKQVVIDKSYLENAKKTFNETRHALSNDLSTMTQIINDINNQKTNLDTYIKQYIAKEGLQTSEITPIQEWTLSPKNPREWSRTLSLGLLFEQAALLDLELLSNRNRREILQLKDQQSEVDQEILNSWYLITELKRHTPNDELVEKEIKKYELKKIGLFAQLQMLKDLREITINSLHTLSLTLERIKTLEQNLSESKTIFGENTNLYYQCEKEFLAIRETIHKRIDRTAQQVEFLSTSISVIDTSLRRIKNMVQELSTEGFWKRSRQSIQWIHIKQVVPEIRSFASAFKARTLNAFAPQTIQSFFGVVVKNASRPESIIRIILGLLLALIFFFLGKLLIRYTISTLESFVNSHGMIYPTLSNIALFTSILAKELLRFYGLVYIWSIFFIVFYYHYMPGSLSGALFFFASIPLWIFVIRGVLRRFFVLNRDQNYLFFSPSLSKRLALVVPLFVYSSITLSFLRAAFLALNRDIITTSSLPDILLALNFILLQIALLSLIGKENILALIPDAPEWGRRLSAFVDTYYYPLLIMLITLIVMSNPFVGYGKQVFYIFSRLGLTLALIPFLIFLHSQLKKATSTLFFYQQEPDAISKERFESGKTWYGFFVIISLAAFFIACGFILAWLWGVPISFGEIRSFLNYELYSPGLDDMGKRIQVTFFSFVKIIMYILGGIVIAYIINNFILKRIFDPLLVGPGVQNTIITLSRYAIIIIALLIGFTSTGLGDVVTKIGLALAVIGFAIKEPLGDFFAYFIILIQRPIKIGDYIKIEDGSDDPINGIVRQISPRSTMLRNKNSTTVFVPNSRMTNVMVRNWSYSKSFIALDDILLMISYSADPIMVKMVIKEMVESLPYALKSPQPIIWLNNFTDNGYQFLVRIFIPSEKIPQKWDLESNTRFELVKVLKKHSIPLACPIRYIKVSPCENGKGENVPFVDISSEPCDKC